jgi:hypothetical protein
MMSALPSDFLLSLPRISAKRHQKDPRLSFASVSV